MLSIGDGDDGSVSVRCGLLQSMNNLSFGTEGLAKALRALGADVVDHRTACAGHCTDGTRMRLRYGPAAYQSYTHLDITSTFHKTHVLWE